MTTPPNVLSVEQGSREWRQARCGLVTASRCGDVTAVRKDKTESAPRANYRAELMCEILTGQPYPQFVSLEMQWGIEHEAEARVAYELREGVLVDTVGFVIHPEIDRFGASPDGIVGAMDDETGGMIQIKCPTTKTHLTWMRAGVVPLEHMPQMLAEMSCTGRAWCDFVSFDPRLPEHLQLFVCRYHRDDSLIALLEREVQNFNDQVDDELEQLPAAPQKIAEVLDWPCADEVEF